MSFIIRDAAKEDMQNINKAHVDSIRNICIADYRQEQIDGWSGVVYTQEHYLPAIANNFYKVVEIDGNIEGMCHAKVTSDTRGEIFGLYLSPKAIGKGIGRQFFAQAGEYFRAHGCSELYVEATRTAKAFYEKMGFKAISGEKLYETRGTAFEYYEMSMPFK